MSNNLVKTIEIDCSPMTARPDTYIEKVIEGTGLELKEPVSKLFGNWTWDYNDDVSDEKWKEIQPILEERLTKLYNDGYCRYCSW